MMILFLTGYAWFNLGWKKKKKSKQKTQRYELFWKEEVRNKDMWDTHRQKARVSAVLFAFFFALNLKSLKIAL